MWEWLLQRGPEYLAQGIVNYAARCPAIPACPASGCPPCPRLVCGDCAGWGVLAYLIFSFGVVVGALVVSSGCGCVGVLRRIGRAAVKKTDSEDELELRPDWSSTSTDVLAVRWSQGYRDVPAGVPRDRVYRFRREPSAARDAEFQQAAEAEAETEGRFLAAAQGVAPPHAGFAWLLPIDGVGQVVGADAGALVPQLLLLLSLRRCRGPLQGVAPVGAQPCVVTLWRAAESGGGFRFGDPVPGHVRTARALGTKDLHVLADGTALFVEEVSPANETSFFDTGVSGDARIMAVRRNRQGRRERTWAEMVADVAREDFTNDWDLPGPRSTLWCLEFVNQEGLGLDGHHERLRSTRKLESSSWGASEHYCVTQALKLGLLKDQVNGSNLMMVDSLFRRLQTIEFAHSERAREQEAKGHGGKLGLEEQMACAGSSRAGGSLMICPLLLDDARGEVEREAPLAQNPRKARDEREGVTPAEALRKLRVAGRYDVDGAALGCAKIGVRAVAAHEKIYPGLAVIPMGWSWALWFCQKIHEGIVEAAGSGPKYWITDKTCAPDLSKPFHTQYVDNCISRPVYGVIGLIFALFSLVVGQKVGRASERWRWGRGGALGGPRRHAGRWARNAATAAALDGSTESAAPWMYGPDDTQDPVLDHAASGLPEAPGHAPGDVYGFGRLAREGEFPEVPGGMIEQDWKVVGRSEWRKKGESIPVLEARATLYGYRHLLRNCHHHGKRLVVLGDSMSVAGAVSKRRSGSRAMMNVTQSIAALSLATGPSLHYRWPPSEWTAADGPSRGRWHPAAPTALAARDARTRGAGPGHRGLAQPGAVDRAPAQDSPGGVEGAPSTSSAPWRWDGRGLEPAYVIGAQSRGRAAAATPRASAPGRFAGPSGLERAAAPQAVRAPGTTALDAAPIQPRTRNRYQEIFRDFLARSNGRPLTSEDLVDEAIAEWLDELYLDGEDLSAGSWAYAAVTFFTGLNKASGALMPRSRRALRGFRSLAPPRSRLPMPCMVVAMVVMELIARRRVESALAVLLVFELYLRPGEAFHIRAADLVPPVSDVSGASHWCVTLHAAETERESKTGEFDESLSLDLGRQSCLGPALNQLASQRLGANWRAAQQRRAGTGHHLAAPLFTGTLADVTKDFKTVVEALGVHTALGAAHMYMLRHGGASRDCASGYRRLEDVRGRSQPSVRRCEKGSRLAQVVLKLTPALQAHGKLCTELLSERVFVEVFSGSGHLSEAISGVGVAALLWDISLGENYDRSDSGPMGLGGLSQADQEKLANARCVGGSKRGICSRTGRGHQQLQGKDPAGHFYAKLAEPYPKRLCKALATAYYNSWAKAAASIVLGLAEARLHIHPGVWLK
ncbi:unnamed protein product [Prorocentrum cordatum]|uniref:Uncharacterized protein n=1 Tax=Prorocentrum cordatum TaxID=2364126 RepID=A0ABN9RS19_9DINO|nr:unnamed protein product [Polarella glacialis]